MKIIPTEPGQVNRSLDKTSSLQGASFSIFETDSWRCIKTIFLTTISVDFKFIGQKYFDNYANIALDVKFVVRSFRLFIFQQTIYNNFKGIVKAKIK